MVVGPVRCNFVQLTEATAETKTPKDGDPYKSFGMQCLYPETASVLDKQLADMCLEAVVARYGSLDKAPTNLKKPVKFGDKEKNTNEFPFYIGQRYFSTTHNAYPKSPAPPAIIDKNGAVGLGEAPPADGSYAMVKVVAKTYTGQGYQPGVSFRIKAVQPISTAEAAKRYAAMGYTGELDDSPLGRSDGPAGDGFGQVDGGATQPENYQEPKPEASTAGAHDFMS